MIITLTGDNALALKSELDKLVAAFVSKEGDLALERIDGEEAEYERIREAITSLPFLASKKMVVLRQASANKEFVEAIEQLSGEVPDTTDLILVEPKLDKRSSYYKFLKSNTDFREFTDLDVQGLTSWLVTKAKEQKGTLSPVDAKYLVERVGANQQLLSNELDKLLLYDSDITRSTIDLLTDESPQSTIFELLDAAFAGRTEKAIKLYEDQRAQKVEAPQIIAMLAWQLHVLAIIKAAGERTAQSIASEAKINPYVVSKSQAIARRLSLSELKRLVNDLLKIDVAIKSTSIDADEALQHYLLKLANV